MSWTRPLDQLIMRDESDTRLTAVLSSPIRDMLDWYIPFIFFNIFHTSPCVSLHSEEQNEEHSICVSVFISLYATQFVTILSLLTVLYPGMIKFTCGLSYVSWTHMKSGNVVKSVINFLTSWPFAIILLAFHCKIITVIKFYFSDRLSIPGSMMHPLADLVVTESDQLMCLLYPSDKPLQIL